MLPVLQKKRDEVSLSFHIAMVARLLVYLVCVFFIAQLSKLQVKLKEELMKKGSEINDFKEKHNIRIQGHEEPAQPAGDSGASNKASAAGVLNKA